MHMGNPSKQNYKIIYQLYDSLSVFHLLVVKLGKLDCVLQTIVA